MDAETGGTTGLRFHASPGTRLGISAAAGIAVSAILGLLVPPVHLLSEHPVTDLLDGVLGRSKG